MALALEGLDLVAIAALLLCIGLLVAARDLLHPLATALEDWSLDLIVWSGHPLAWLGRDIEKWIIAGIDSAITALGTAVETLWRGLTWSLEEMLSAITDLASKARAAIVYAVDQVVKPWAEALVKPIRADASKALSEAEATAKALPGDLAGVLNAAEAFGWKRLADAEGFTKTEIAAARADLGGAIATLSSYVHTAEAGAEALPGTIAGDFGSLWEALREYVRPTDLEKLLGAGLLSGMLLRVIAQASGLDSSECQAKHKQICGVDPSQWTKLLEGLALLGFGLDFKQMYDFALTVTGEIGDALVALEDAAWSEFGG